MEAHWGGWLDDMSGVDRYTMEIFKLQPNIHGELIEMKPLNPIFTKTLYDASNSVTYAPTETAMYSVLLQVSDKANNSKYARELFLYDNMSNIEYTKPGLIYRMPTLEEIQDMTRGDGGFHVLSAIPETGYLWQTANNGSKTRIIFNWENHFVNKPIEQGKLLNKVLPYPTQFKDLQDDGVLRSSK